MHFASDGARPVLVAGAVVALVAGPVGRAVLLESAVALVPVNIVVEALKRVTFRARPDGSRRRSNAGFPSSHAANGTFASTTMLRPPESRTTMSGRTPRPSTARSWALTWVSKSQCSTIPASSTTRCSCTSPQRPRTWGARSAPTSDRV